MPFLFFHYRAPILLLVFAIALIILRILLTASFFYAFLLWNLCLAIVPYIITQSIYFYGFHKISIGLKIVLFFIWLLFLPNAPYLITDLVHLHSPYSDWKWFDLFTVFVFAFTGLFFGTLSLMDVQKLCILRFGNTITETLLFLVCILMGYGIFLGRFLRFNSWDILLRPTKLLIWSFTALGNIKTWMMSLAFGLFIWLIFLALKWVKEA